MTQTEIKMIINRLFLSAYLLLTAIFIINCAGTDRSMAKESAKTESQRPMKVEEARSGAAKGSRSMPTKPATMMKRKYSGGNREKAVMYDKATTNGSGSVFYDDYRDEDEESRKSEEKKENQTTQQSRLIIYNADLQLLSNNVENTIQKLVSMTKRYGGYVESIISDVVTIRVPYQKFYPALNKIEKYGQIKNKKISAEDITKLYSDLKLRLKNLKKVKNRLEKALKKAKTVDEAHKIIKELERITEKIEAIEGRLNYLKKSAMFSTIKVRVKPIPTGPQISSSYLDVPRGPYRWINSLGIKRLLDY